MVPTVRAPNDPLMPDVVTRVPESGQLAQVRGRRFVAIDVRRSQLSSGARAQHLVSLSSLEDGSLGEELQVIWEAEIGARSFEREQLPQPTSFDDPSRLDAFLDAVRWGVVSAADRRTFHAPFRSGIEIEDYQLDPLVRAVQMPRVNLLIADAVGLGKTIEAGLIVQELIFRNRVRTALIVCPAALQIQWREEMWDKFGLDFRIVDSALVKHLRRTRGVHANPWGHFPRLITSYAYLRRDRNLRLFQDLLPADGQPTYPRRFDLLICDEAHNLAPSGRGARNSQQTAAVQAIAPQFEHRLFLSATPHNGYTESFTALLELLDNQRYARGASINLKQLHGVTMVRRLRSELGKDWTGNPRFPERLIVPIEVDYPEEEREIHRLLREYGAHRRAAASTQAHLTTTEFLLKLIKKRLFSSPAAFLRTLRRHRATLTAAKPGARPAAGGAPGILRRMVEGLEEEHEDDDAYEETLDGFVEEASAAAPALSDREREILDQMLAWAERAAHAGDAKGDRLVEWLRSVVKPHGEWARERVIVFTEFRDTQNWLAGLLAGAGLGDHDRVMKLYGGMLPPDREAVKAAFQASPDDSPVRILLATDAASEGINLQNHCHRLVHVEIPWNPNRLEQRNGRIDRHGQKHDVEVFHFVAKGYRSGARDRPRDALEADLEFLMRAAEKVNQIREDLGKVGPVIAQQVEEAMLGRRTELDTRASEQQAEPVRNLLKAERDVREQIRRLADRLEEVRTDLRLSPENVKHVVDVGLELAGQPPLAPAAVHGVSAWRMPALRGAWEACLHGLAHPHSGRLRPVVFDHNAARGRDDVVLVHLNHRLVQMCLRLLRAQIWSAGVDARLSRFTARVVAEGHLRTPALVAYGRLLVLGATHRKLHEELVTAGGWIEEGRFRRMSVAELDAALRHLRDELAAPALQDGLRALWPKLENPLRAAVQARGDEVSRGLERRLAELAETEKREVTAILTELKHTLESSLQQPDQLALDLEDGEDDRTLDALHRRIDAIPEEITQECALIDRRYADPLARLFPVAVTFLVPERMARPEAR